MSATNPTDLSQIEQALKISQMVADTARKQQEFRFAPWQLAFTGMTAGAAIFAAGVAFSRIVLGGGP
jgi:hypothetical protein